MDAIKKKSVRIMGIRGIPATHGGFETFAEYLALYLVENGWTVTVYCQQDGSGAIYEDSWCGVNLIKIPVSVGGAAGTIVFDWKATIHAAKKSELVLTLGYNTAIFCALLRLKGILNLINMDGIEWRRKKWGVFAKTWFWINERAGCWLGNHLIADHPDIAKHLQSRVSEKKITMIPYGSNRVSGASVDRLAQFGLIPFEYAILIARAEPENSILEIVRSWSRKSRGAKLVVLGNYDSANEYHQAVRNVASEEIIFVGAIYDKPTVEALRFYAEFYLHGHQVGGTNPSLVEAMGAGNAVLAHDNRFNRWVLQQGAYYFSDENECANLIDEILENRAAVKDMRHINIDRHLENFTWERILGDYEQLLLTYH